MQKRLPLVFRHITYNLRGGFLLRPLAIAVSLGIVGATFSWLEEIFPVFGNWVPSILFPSRSDPVVAQVILSAIATSIMTVVSIVFAILLMTLTLASTQFSPRILISFSRDRGTQRTLGIFLGTFCYCIAALPRGADDAQTLRAGDDGDGSDAAGAGVRGMAALFHPSYFARDQREFHHRSNRRRNGSRDPRDDAFAAPA